MANGKFMISVEIDDWIGSPIHQYKFNMNDHKERAVFAEQANNALRNGQVVTTWACEPSEE